MVERETWPDRPDSWCSSTKLPLRDEQGNVIGTFGISRDITDLKRFRSRTCHGPRCCEPREPREERIFGKHEP